MKILNKLVLGGAALVLLTACGPSKVSYDKFHEEAVNAAKLEVPFTKVVLNGYTNYNGLKVEFDKTTYQWKDGKPTTDDNSVAALAGLKVFVYDAAFVGNNESFTYYFGNGSFKVTMKAEQDNGTATFNKYGLLTSMKGKVSGVEQNFTVKWSK